jgi:DNA primase
MPISWEECAKLKSSVDFTVQNARRYLEKRKSDPWKDFDSRRVDLAAIAAHTPLPKGGDSEAQEAAPHPRKSAAARKR